MREEVADEAQAARPAAHSSGRKKWAEVDPQLQRREYSVAEAVGLIQELAVANFDESIDVVMKLGLDPRKADQQIRGMAALPHNTGKAVRLCVFAEPEQQAGLAEAGAEWVGGEELMEQILEGEVALDFNRCLASPSIMPLLGDKLGRILGPKRLMPNVKVGTVTSDLKGGVGAALRGQAPYRLDKGANIHCSVGRVSMSPCASLSPPPHRRTPATLPQERRCALSPPITDGTCSAKLRWLSPEFVAEVRRTLVRAQGAGGGERAGAGAGGG